MRILQALFIVTIVALSYFLGTLTAKAALYGDSNSIDPIDYESLVKLIDDNELKNIESVIPLLPQELLTNHILMFKSRSLQEAHYMMPRAILYSNSARFFLTFNGHKNQRGFDMLEIIQFRDDSAKWEFREIDFSGSSPKFSEANPAKCMECHQSSSRKNIDPRPNWEPYNVWLGAYGGNNGKFDKIRIGSHLNRFTEDDAAFVEDQNKEREMYQKFESKIKSNHPRYKHLGAFDPHRTTEMTDVLGDQNFKRVARLIQETGPIYDYFKYALVGAGRCSARDYIPEDLKTEMKTAWENGGYKTRTSPRFVSQLEMIFESLGVSTKDWSMDFKTSGRFAFSNRFGTPSFPAAQFYKALNAADPELTNYTCEELDKKSLKTLSPPDVKAKIRSWIATNEDKLEASTLGFQINRCMKCHDGSEKDIPVLRLDSEGWLKQNLNETGYKKGNLLNDLIYRLSDLAYHEDQMPPSGEIADQDRRELIKYFKSFN